MCVREDILIPVNDISQSLIISDEVTTLKSKSIIDSGVLAIEPVEKAKREIRREAKRIYSKDKEMG